MPAFYQCGDGLRLDKWQIFKSARGDNAPFFRISFITPIHGWLISLSFSSPKNGYFSKQRTKAETFICYIILYYFQNKLKKRKERNKNQQYDMFKVSIKMTLKRNHNNNSASHALIYTSKYKKTRTYRNNSHSTNSDTFWRALSSFFFSLTSVMRVSCVVLLFSNNGLFIQPRTLT